MKTHNIIPLSASLLVMVLAVLACGIPTTTVVPEVNTPPAPLPTNTTAPLPTDTTAPLPTPVPLDLAAGLIAYYPFNGDLLDASSHGHDGTLYEPVFVEDLSGNPNSALTFNGASTVVVIPDADELDLTGDFTISMWVRGEPNPTHQWLLIAKHQAGQCLPAEASWFLRYQNPNNGLHISHYDRSAECGTHPGYGTLVPLDDGAWHNLVVTYVRNSRQMSVYFDCQSVFSQQVTWAPENNDIPLTLGNQYGGPASTNFGGVMDDVRLYDRAMSEAGIQMLCTP